MERVKSLLEETPKDENLILVSHGDVIKALIAIF
jgi:hypothetical protein